MGAALYPLAALFDGQGGCCRPALTFVAMVVDFAFALSVLGFLIMHARMAAINATTIEMYEKRRSPQWRYNRGLVNNLREVFGPRWVIHPHSQGPGVEPCIGSWAHVTSLDGMMEDSFLPLFLPLLPSQLALLALSVSSELLGARHSAC